MGNTKDLSVIIPSYLEEENLRILLPRIIGNLTKPEISFEVLIIDTIAAMDDTKTVCLEAGVTYVNRENGNRYGDAIRTAISRATGKHILFMDADGSHSPEFIIKLYEWRHEADVVVASRFIAGGGSDNTRVLIFMSWTVNFIYRVLFGLKCKDVSNSFKLYDADQLKKLRLTCDNFDIIEEILIKLKRANRGLRIKELPYVFKERMFGKTKRNLVVFVFSYAFTLVRLKFSR